ncbi:hypothetical protein O181_018138 [Austropuccinia psidii MF-1]|uniref:Integrase catalytic domain-containing protein n=1 Tax=Austropuccinia psidii MF-1 TaxID=1389203 RepID=A0A9Q3C8H1_9BASI|nr:hypothetical protein [Austropuccinia psidii MF-1]
MSLHNLSDLWLQRLGHPNERETKQLIPTYSKKGMNCNECAKGKLTAFHFSHSFKPVSHPLEVVHMDLCGPIQTQSLSGARYFMILVNQFTGFVTINFLKNKSEAFQLAKESGFNHWNSPPYTLEHNGVAKRSNRSIIEKTRCLLQQANLADQFWAEVASTATYLHNQTPKNDAILLYAKWFGCKPCMDKLRSFVCKAWVRIPLATHFSKFGTVAWEGILLRYENHSLAYRILRISDKRVIISRHIKFDELCFPALISFPIKNPLNTPILHFFSNLPFYCSSTHGDTANEVDDCSVAEEVIHHDLEEQPTQRIRVIAPRHPTLISSDVTTDKILPYKRRAHRTTKSTVPKTYEEATEKTPRMAIIPLPVHGSSKSRNMIINKSPNIRPRFAHNSIRALTSNAAINNYQFHQLDVKSVFLNALLEEEICLAVPNGLEVLQLNKAIYGLKQAPLAWYNHLSKWRLSVGFVCSLSDSCVFCRKGPTPIWIYVHLDDLALFGPNTHQFKNKIQQKFDMTDLGKANLLLRIKNLHSSSGFSLSQEHYIESIAKTYHISEMEP